MPDVHGAVGAAVNSRCRLAAVVKWQSPETAAPDDAAG